MRLFVPTAALIFGLLSAHAAAPVSPAEAQDSPRFPQLSPWASARQTIGTTLISIDYHRPAVRGRAIWGALVPYGQVWRAGANEATTIRFSDAVKVDGQPVKAGTYALFMIPDRDQWTVILNRRAKQWGAYEYDPRQDLIRFEVKSKPAPHAEWLTYALDPASESTAYVQVNWEKVKVSFLVEVDVEAIVTARMKKLFAQRPGDWKVYSEAAEYGLQQKVQLSQALTWADRSLSIQQNPTNLAVKARLLHEAGQRPQAASTMEKALHLAKSRHDGLAITGPLEKDLSDWKSGR